MRCTFAHRLIAFIFVCLGVATPTTKVLAADEGQSYAQADRVFTEALARGDQKTVAALLDDNFQWVESDGRIHTKPDVLKDLRSLASNNEGAIDVRTIDLLGQVERVLGIHRTDRFAHIWVKHPGGWQAFTFLDIPIPVERSENTAVPKAPTNPDADCENPCRTLPFKPENAAQKGAMDAWFRLKNDEWHPNSTDWAAYADDDHETITPTSDLPKLQHVVELAKQRELYGEHGADPGEPVISMRMFDFGNVVVQQCFQGPNSAKPRTWVMRVFVNKGDGWKIVLSAQTRIKQG
jgi:uncharacterized protein DUF4440